MHRRSLLVLAAALLVSCEDPEPVEPGPDPDPEPEYVDLPEALAEAFVAEQGDLEAPGVAVAIRHGDSYYAQAFGSRHPEQDEPLSPTALFRIGSITKMVTATALLAQVDSGALSLDDTVEDWVPGLELDGEGAMAGISLHELLTHQSGLYDYSPIAGGGADELLAQVAYGDFPSSAYHMAPDGLFWNYSNTNFSLAGLAVEEADGRWYREVVGEDVFAPLGMERSGFLGEDVLEDGDYALAWGWDWTGLTAGQLLVEPDSYDDAWLRPAGYAWSSVLELSEFGRFLVHGNPDVLSSAMHAELIARQIDTQMLLDTTHYGYGVMAIEGRALEDALLDIETREHDGATPGYAASLVTVPEDDLVIAVLASTDGAYFRQSISAAIESLAGPELTDLPDIEEDPLRFADYAGTYQDAIQVGAIEVSQEGDSLVVSAPTLDAVNIDYSPTLLPSSPGNFYWFVGDFPHQLTFVRNPGETEGATQWLRSRFFVAEREEEAARSESSPLAADRAELIELLSPARLRQLP